MTERVCAYTPRPSARIERGHSDRAVSAKKKDGLLVALFFP